MAKFKDLKDTIVKVSATNLENRLGYTIQGKYVKEIDNQIINDFKQGGGVLNIYTLQYFLSHFKGFKEELHDTYLEIMGDAMAGEGLDFSTIYSQGALLDGLCFVYDSQKGSMVLATMNLSLLYDLDVEFDMVKQISKKNKENLVKAYRIDIEYLDSEKEFTFKAVNARDFDIDDPKKDSDETKRFFIIPYLSVLRVMMLIQNLLYKGNLLYIKQIVGGVEKNRVITCNKEVLGNYCDDAEIVKGVEPRFFPLKGYFYAPVLGAPSTSAMVTNINIMDIQTMSVISPADVPKLGIKKPENVLRNNLAESLAINTLLNLAKNEPEKFDAFIQKVNNNENVNHENASAGSIHRVLANVNNTESLYKAMGISGEIDRRYAVFQGGSKVVPKQGNNYNKEDIAKALESGVCKFIIQKKDCRLSSIMGTNNKEILKKFYGDDYYGKYESFAGRYYGFMKEAESTGDVRGALSKYGFPCTDELIQKLLDKDKEKWEAILAEASGINLERSKSARDSAAKENNIMLRTLDAYKDPVTGTVYEYYKYLDVAKIVNMVVY